MARAGALERQAIEWERGKRGGVRVIYFFHDADMRLFVLTADAENQRADLSRQDRNDFERLTRKLVEIFEGR